MIHQYRNRRPELNWDDLYIDDFHYEFDPVNEEWIDYDTDQPVPEPIKSLLFYIQTINLPRQSNESLKFMIDELQKTIEYKNLEIEKLREQTGFYK